MLRVDEGKDGIHSSKVNVQGTISHRGDRGNRRIRGGTCVICAVQKDVGGGEGLIIYTEVRQKGTFDDGRATAVGPESSYSTCTS